MIDVEAIVREEVREWLKANREFAAGELRRAALEEARALTMEEFARYASCANVRQAVDFCREQRIRVSGTRKKRFVMRAEIDAWLVRTARLLAAPGAGTAIARVVEMQQEAA